MGAVKRRIQFRPVSGQEFDGAPGVGKVAWPVGRDVEQSPLTVYSSESRAGMVDEKLLEYGHIAASNRFRYINLHCATKG